MHQLFSLFQTDLISLLKNKVQLYKHYNLNDETIDKWEYWRFEEIIKIVNDLTEEENNQRKSQEADQKASQPKIPDASSYMNSMSNKFK